ncbi:MAG: putative phosphate transporter phosphate-binding protein [Actinomycetota bacterium]|jgi:phosphate transport system substrate-binding protein
MSKRQVPPVRKALRLGLAFIVAGSVAAVASPASAESKEGDSCKRADLFEVQAVGSTYLRCEVKKGSSLHAKKPAFAWKKVTKAQFDYSKVKSSRTIRIDGSSTVYPLMAVAAKYFQQTTGDKVLVSIGISGTGGGFEKFCKGETDMSNASRQIKKEEAAACAAKGITYKEVILANDGLAVVVNPKSPVTCLTMDQLKKMWSPKSGSSGAGGVSKWDEVVPGSTLGNLELFGAGSDSGTFDSFNTFTQGTYAAGKRTKDGGSTTSRTDYNASENDNDTVKGVSAKQNALGYFGLSYVEENKTKVKAVALDAGAGCVKPTIKTVQDASYPMARALYVYIKTDAIAKNPAIKRMMQFYFDNAKTINSDALFVPLTPAQIKILTAEIKAL